MTVRGKLLVATSLTAVLVALGACSSSGTHPSSSASTTGATTASGSSQPAGTPIKVGEICSCSGVPGFSQYAVPIQQSVKAWADGVNASGGVDGHPVELIAEDDATNPGTSVTKATTLISDHVVAIIDDTTLVESWAPAAEAAKIPVVGTDSINPPFDSSPDFYAEGQTNDTTLAAIVAIAKQAGAKNIGLIYCAESPVCAESVPLMKSAGKTEGVPDIYSESISASAPNYTAQCVAAKQAGVTTLFVADVGTIIEHFAADCQQQNYTPTYITEAAGFTMDQASAPGLSKDLWSQYPDVPFWANTPAVQAYDTVMDKYYPGVRKDIPIFNEDAFMGWVSAKLLQAGIDAGGLTATATPSSAEVTSGLNSLKGDTLGGLTPPLTFVAGQPHHVNCYFVGHIQNGKPTLVNSGQASCLSNTSSS